MKSFFKLLEKTAGPIGLLTATAGAILDFLTPLGSYIYLLTSILLVLTVLSAICSKSNPILQKVKNSTAFAPDFIKNELVELWQPDGAAFWKKGLFQVLTFLTALSLGAGVYAKDNPNGFLATKIDSVASLQTNLGLIDSKLGDISNKQDKIIKVIEKTDKKIDLVKKETSDNPRKELANLGVDWDEDSFVESMINNDKKTFNLFIKGGFKLPLNENSFRGLIYEYMKKNQSIEMLKEAIVNGAINKDFFINSKSYIIEDLKITNYLNNKAKSIEAFNRNLNIQKNRQGDVSDSPFFSIGETKPLLMAILMKKQNFVKYFVSLGANTKKETFYVYDFEKFEGSGYKLSFDLDIQEESEKFGMVL